jgi:hypothetical protein
MQLQSPQSQCGFAKYCKNVEGCNANPQASALLGYSKLTETPTNQSK